MSASSIGGAAALQVRHDAQSTLRIFRLLFSRSIHRSSSNLLVAAAALESPAAVELVVARRPS